jgi:uncharacterized protein with von Willebrand factor type A (vWA) domain
MVEIEWCTRCSTKEPEANRILRELTHSSNRSIESIRRQLYRHQAIKEKAEALAEKRQQAQDYRLKNYQQQLKEYEEKLSLQALEELLQGKPNEQIAQSIINDKLRQELEQAINSLKYQPREVDSDDIELALKEYEQQGYLELEGGKFRITSRGAKLMAKQALRKALEGLTKREIGPHSIKEAGYGSEISLTSRKYQLGDEYELVDIEKTVLNALERSGRVSLEVGDFQIFETQHQTRLCAGLLIDESGSMQGGGKIEAAIDASLALAELISRQPKDSLKVCIFADRVIPIATWEIVNQVIGKGSTDIQAVMHAFRRKVIHQKGDKQAYLITDSEPNTEDGIYVGFERAMEGVLKEAQRYRECGITLNIVMLDERPPLQEFARILARKNLGRVFFTSPANLGKAIIEDYLRIRRKRL